MSDARHNSRPSLPGGTATAALERRARRAYEGARWRQGARVGSLVAVAGALALVGCSHRRETALVALAVAVGVTVAEWRGLEWRRGARAGLAAGFAPFLLPVAARWFSLCTEGSIACAAAPFLCFVGGLAGGALLGFGPASRPHGRPFWACALAVTASLGAVGCLSAGLAGLAGMAMGLAAGAVPALALARAR